MSGSANISPTAHYTGEVWRRNGLSHPWLGTREGRVLFDALHPVNALSGRLGGPSLESYLPARHAAIDALLERGIAAGTIGQVIEIAAGMSPRGWRMTAAHGAELTYVEADLPAMADRKRRALERIGSLGEHHRVVELDALRPAGPGSLDALAAQLDPSRPTAIVTEGLLGYLPTPAVLTLWRRIAAALGTFPAGHYISDIHLRAVQGPAVRAFRMALAAFVRGGVYLHFDDAPDAQARLRGAGFAAATVRPAGEVVAVGDDRSSRMVHILEASTD